MKHFLRLLTGLAIVVASSTANAQIDWAAGAPGGTTGGSIQLGAERPPTNVEGSGFFLDTGISAAQIAPSQATIDALGVSGDYTISAWINSDQGATLATDNRWWLGTGNQGLHLGVQAGSLATTGHWGADSNATTQVPVNTWVHVTHVFNAGFQDIFVNGVLESSTANAAPNMDGTDIQIGSRNGEAGPGWGGFIDDVAIFTSALTDTQIASLATPTADPVGLGAVAYYNFEDDQTGTTVANLVDVTVSGLTGTPDPETGVAAPALQQLDGVGAELPPIPPVASWAAGAPGGTSGGSVEFDGTAANFLATGISSDQIGGNRADGSLSSSDYSVSAWINSGDDNAGNAANNRWYFGTGNQGIHLGIQGSDADGDSGTLELGHWSADSSGSTVVPSNTWVHATFTYDADGGLADDGVTVTGMASIYLNGVLDATANQAGPNRSVADLQIGGRNGGGGPAWIGLVDDVAIFTSVLSPTEVDTLFNDTTQAPALGAVAYYDFEDDQSGTTAANLVDVATSGLVGTNGDPAPQFLDRIEPMTDALKGDVDVDGDVDFDDIPAFILVLQSGGFQAEADCDCSGSLDFDDIPAFIAILQNQ